MLKRLQIHNFVKNSFRTNYVSSKESKNTPFEYLLQWITQREPSIVAATCLQSWACVSKITSRLAPVRRFQTLSRLALSRIYKQKNFASLAFRVIAYRVSKIT